MKETIDWRWFDEAVRLWAPYFWSKRKASKEDWEEIHFLIKFHVKYYMEYELLQSQTQEIKEKVDNWLTVIQENGRLDIICQQMKDFSKSLEKENQDVGNGQQD